MRLLKQIIHELFREKSDNEKKRDALREKLIRLKYQRMDLPQPRRTLFTKRFIPQSTSQRIKQQHIDTKIEAVLTELDKLNS